MSALSELPWCFARMLFEYFCEIIVVGYSAVLRHKAYGHICGVKKKFSTLYSFGVDKIREGLSCFPLKKSREIACIYLKILSHCLKAQVGCQVKIYEGEHLLHRGRIALE